MILFISLDIIKSVHFDRRLQGTLMPNRKPFISSESLAHSIPWPNPQIPNPNLTFSSPVLDFPTSFAALSPPSPPPVTVNVRFLGLGTQSRLRQFIPLFLPIRTRPLLIPTGSPRFLLLRPPLVSRRMKI